MNENLGTDSEDAKIQNYLIMFESWLEIATKQEIQARQARSTLIFTSLASGIALSSLFINANYWFYAPWPLAWMIVCSIVFNHYYQTKAACWKKSAEEVIIMQKKTIGSMDVQKMEEELDRFNLHDVYKKYRKDLRKLHLDLPSKLMYMTLFVLVFILLLLAFGVALPPG